MKAKVGLIAIALALVVLANPNVTDTLSNVPEED